MKRIYVAGGMTGIQHFNFPAFDRAAARLRDEGNEVFSPADNDRRLLSRPCDWIPQEYDSIGPWRAWAIPGAPGIRTMLGDDVAWICKEATAIAMLPGWEHSKGARAEWHLSLALGHEVMYL